MIKAREVRERLKGRVDPQVQYVCEALAEQQGVQLQMINSLAEMLDQQTNIIMQFTAVATNMKSAIDNMNKMRGIDKEDDGRFGDVTT